MIRTAPPGAVSRLLIARLAETGDPERSPTLGEVVGDLLPYAAVRAALGLTTKAEYDLALLGWLGSEADVRVDPSLAAAVDQELSAPEPGLELVERFADARIDPVRHGSAAGDVSSELPPAPRSRTGLAEAEEEPSIPAPPSKPDRPRTPVGLDPGVAGVRGGEDEDEPAARVHAPSGRAFSPTPPSRGGRSAGGLVFRFASDEPGRSPAGPGETGNGSKAAESVDPARQPQAATVAARSEPRRDGDRSADRPTPQRPPDPASATRIARPRCRECSRPLPSRAAARYCPHCGADQTDGRCAACGDRLEAEWAYCPRCGRPVEPA